MGFSNFSTIRNRRGTMPCLTVELSGAEKTMGSADQAAQVPTMVVRGVLPNDHDGDDGCDERAF
jgi:hypothetical protein